MSARAVSIAAISVLSLASCAGDHDARGATEAPVLPPMEQAAPEEAVQPRGRRGPWTEELTLENAPHPRIAGAPSAIVHAPPSFDPARPLRLVIFLHGWSGCARVLMRQGEVPCRDGERPREGWGLDARFDASGSDALFVVLQLAFMERSGDAGRLTEPGRFRALTGEILAALAEPLAGNTEIDSITLLAHSAGFESALAVLRHEGDRVRNVVLFDALYRGVEPFADWAAGGPDRRLVSLYTGTARTARLNRLLADAARARVGRANVAQDLDRPLAELVRQHRVVIARSPAPHGGVPARHIPELLAPLGLSPRP